MGGELRIDLTSFVGYQKQRRYVERFIAASV